MSPGKGRGSLKHNKTTSSRNLKKYMQGLIKSVNVVTLRLSKVLEVGITSREDLCNFMNEKITAGY